jgi:3-deoxy-D-arabino-heptulosonate 7-phosphate (DAHP) synthase
MIEVHCNPCEALCDKDQAMSPDMFAGLMKKLNVLSATINEINRCKENETSEEIR